MDGFCDVTARGGVVGELVEGLWVDVRAAGTYEGRSDGDGSAVGRREVDLDESTLPSGATGSAVTAAAATVQSVGMGPCTTAP